MSAMCLEPAHSKSSSPTKSERNWRAVLPSIRCRMIRCSAPKGYSRPPRAAPTMTSPVAWTPGAKSSANGANAFSKSAYPGWRNVPDRAAPGLFPPELVVRVKARACELPAPHHVPLSRWSVEELTRHVCQSGLVAQVSGTTLWRWDPRGCHPALAASLLDLPPRSGFRPESRTDSGSLPGPMAGPGSAGG